MDPSHLKKQVISFENYFKPIFSFKQYSIFSLTTGFWGQEGDLREYIAHLPKYYQVLFPFMMHLSVSGRESPEMWLLLPNRALEEQTTETPVQIICRSDLGLISKFEKA